MSLGLLLLRLVVGATMFSHGAQKLFGWFGGGGPQGTAGFMGQLGFRAPLVMAISAGLGEVGGLAFAAGFVTPLAALGIAVVMINAITLVHWSKGFFNGNGGIEFPLTLLTVAVAVAATGPGRFSVDHALGWDDNLSGAWWGVGVLGAALLISFITLATFRKREAVRATTA
ncbi:MAG: putative oxidoreductase [Gaiellaceae bacterium]|jgi:putative oxidoreductase|nr:putative oxidoreductase [Gaiellaceae bacterium]